MQTNHSRKMSKFMNSISLMSRRQRVVSAVLLSFVGAGCMTTLRGNNKFLQENVSLDLEKCSSLKKSTSQSVSDMIGNTPLLELTSISLATGCRILAKAEHTNPGFSVKDRVAKQMIEEAEKNGVLKPGYTIVEATGGNTGIGIALIASNKGYPTIFTMPDYVTSEKQSTMRLYGAKVLTFPPCSFENPEHFYHQAERIASTTLNTVFLNQFENTSNFNAHYYHTGPEIFHQSGGNVDGFVCAMGTGGTMSGCSTYLKEKNPKLITYLIDPPGSSMMSWFTKNEMKPEGGATILQGVGLNRRTKMVDLCQSINGAFRACDRESIEMCFYLLRNEGLFVGPTAAANVCGAVKLARIMGPGKTILTILCDSGQNYTSTAFNNSWLSKRGLSPISQGTDLTFVT